MHRIVIFVVGALAALATTAAADHGWQRRPPRPRPLDLGHLRAVTAACQDAFEGAANEQACIATVTRGRTRFDIPTTIRACEAAFDGDANELACLGIAVRAWRDPAPLIAACEGAFDGDANELACTRTVTRSWLAPAAVTACESAFDGDANEQACLDALVGTRYEPSELVAFCEENQTGDADELACLGRYR